MESPCVEWRGATWPRGLSRDRDAVDEAELEAREVARLLLEALEREIRNLLQGFLAGHVAGGLNEGGRHDREVPAAARRVEHDRAGPEHWRQLGEHGTGH